MVVVFGGGQVHFRATSNKHPLGLGPAQEKGKEWSMPQKIWSEDELNSIQVKREQQQQQRAACSVGLLARLGLHSRCWGKTLGISVILRFM